MIQERNTPSGAIAPTRRSFIRDGALLQTGVLAALGLDLAGFFRLRAAARPAAAAGVASRREISCILIWLDGGPSHLETFDPKPEAPSEVRGEFKAIPTAIDGVQICEHLPRIARALGDAALIRSLTHELGNHDTASHFLLTGHRPSPALEYPSLGSLIARESNGEGRLARSLPPYIAVPGAVPSARAGFLPASCSPFSVGGDPAAGGYRVRDLEPPPGITLRRLERRRALQDDLDRFARGVDQEASARARRGMESDPFRDEAWRLITSREARAAFDLSAEAPASRERYGRSRIGSGCLLARRLVEAGARFVTVVDSGWDTHQGIFKALPDALFPGSGKLPALDRAWSALIGDLKERGLLERTLVLLLGEFGRTPKLNSLAGRDHWPRAGSALLAGGGVRGGRAIGSTGPHGETPAERPVRPEDLAATILELLGVDPSGEISTPDGRPVKILREGETIRELW